MPKKSKTTTTELLVAIFAVIFIFSLIGVISFKQQHLGSWVVAQNPPAVPSAPSPAGTTLQGGSQQVTVTEGVQVSQPATGPAGTTLSSGSSDFQVMMPK